MKQITSLVICLFIAVFAFAQQADTDSKKLRISILGDSYSTYEGYLMPDTNEIWYFKPDNPQLHNKNDVRSVEETWWYQVVKNMQAELEVNNSFSGATICHTGYSKGPEPCVMLPGLEKHRDYTNRSFENRSNRLGNPDVILIFGSTNDSWCGAPIGDYVFGNQNSEQLYYFRPALAKLLADLNTNYPTAYKLFILNTELKKEINESVHTICKHYAISCLDLKEIDKQQGHPSVKGMKSIAEQVTAYLKKNL